MPGTETLDDPRINTPVERPERRESPRRTREIRVPRLLVATSEIAWRLLVCVAAAAVVLIGLVKVGFALIPVAIALLLSTLFVPPARWLRRRGAPPALAAAMAFVGGLLVIAGLVALV